MAVEETISQLIGQCRQGDPAARERLFQRYRHYLTRSWQHLLPHQPSL